MRNMVSACMGMRRARACEGGLDRRTVEGGNVGGFWGTGMDGMLWLGADGVIVIAAQSSA